MKKGREAKERGGRKIERGLRERETEEERGEKKKVRVQKRGRERCGGGRV